MARKRMSFRTAACIFFFALCGVLVAAYTVVYREWSWMNLGAFVLCVPPLFHKFVIPEKMVVKHYFLTIGTYLLFFGAFALMFVSRIVQIPEPLLAGYGVVAFACYAVGALMPPSFKKK